MPYFARQILLTPKPFGQYFISYSVNPCNPCLNTFSVALIGNFSGRIPLQATTHQQLSELPQSLNVQIRDRCCILPPPFTLKTAKLPALTPSPAPLPSHLLSFSAIFPALRSCKPLLEKIIHKPRIMLKIAFPQPPRITGQSEHPL